MVDQSTVMIQLEKENISLSAQIQYVVADFMKYSFHQKYRKVTSCLVIHFIQDKKFFLQKVFDLLEEIGVFFLYTISLEENKWDEKYWRQFMLNHQVTKRSMGSPEANLLSY